VLHLGGHQRPRDPYLLFSIAVTPANVPMKVHSALGHTAALATTLTYIDIGRFNYFENVHLKGVKMIKNALKHLNS